MLNFLKRLFRVISGSQEVAADEIPSEIRSAVLDFVQARYDLEIACWKISEDYPSPAPNRSNSEGHKLRRDLYVEHTQKWYSSRIKPATSFGYSEEPDFDRDSVTFLSSTRKRGGWVVRTQQQYSDDDELQKGTSRQFEYHLVDQDGEWRFKALFSIWSWGDERIQLL